MLSNLYLMSMGSALMITRREKTIPFTRHMLSPLRPPSWIASEPYNCQRGFLPFLSRRVQIYAVHRLSLCYNGCNESLCYFDLNFLHQVISIYIYIDSYYLKFVNTSFLFTIVCSKTVHRTEQWPIHPYFKRLLSVKLFLYTRRVCSSLSTVWLTFTS